MNFNAAFEQLPTGWLSKQEAELLWKTAQETTGDILEVGCYYGRSTVLLAQLDRPLHTVDPFIGFATKDMSGKKAETAWRKNAARFDNVTLFKMKIEDWESRPCGFTYLDGDHSYVGTCAQIDKARECNPTAIAVHDYASTGGGRHVRKACLKLLGKPRALVGKMAIFGNKK
jgi:hypothetical protein